MISHLITDFYNSIPVSVHSLEVVLIGNMYQTLNTAHLSLRFTQTCIILSWVLPTLSFQPAPLNIWQCDRTASLMFDMLLQKS